MDPPHFEDLAKTSTINAALVSLALGFILSLRRCMKCLATSPCWRAIVSYQKRGLIYVRSNQLG
jgi:hypothetical protein